MKNLIFFFVLLSLFGCKTETEQVQILTDDAWKNILMYSLVVTNDSPSNIFKKYNNSGLKDYILYAYANGTFFGYEISDSITNYINTRKNKPITNQLDTMFNMKFILDTNDFHKDYFMYSEPFYVNNEIICVAMANKKAQEHTSLNWVFFFKKQKKKLFILMGYYDFKKDIFYKAINLSHPHLQ